MAEETQTETTNEANLPAKREVMLPSAVIDAGEFQNLLDSNRFAQLQRVANLFAASAMVPVHFQKKPADCFIGCQMAMRLGVDPFMFLQNTYVIGGKPAMQGALALSLVNTSGLFASPLRFVFDGKEGTDEYGCRAVTTLKTGEVIEGPKVTWAIVKAEGWMGRSGSKWKTIPDLMFRYRAAAWFGRTVCPERLMGMQTVEEIDDIEPRQVEARVLQPAMEGGGLVEGRRKFGFAGKTPTVIEQAPPKEEPAAEQVNTETGEVTGGQEAEQPQAEQQEEPPIEQQKEPELPTTEREKPAAPDLSTWNSFSEAIAGVAQDKKIAPTKLLKALDLALMHARMKGTPEKTTPVWRNALYNALVNGKFNLDTGRLMAA